MSQTTWWRNNIGELNRRLKAGKPQQRPDGQPVHAAFILEEVVSILKLSKTGQGLLDVAASHGISIGFDPLSSSLAYYKYQDRYIGLGLPVSEGTGYSKPLGSRGGPDMGHLVKLAAHELSHGHEHLESRLDAGHVYRPEDAILNTRLHEADAEAVSVLVAWELKEAGWDPAWKAALSSPGYGDIAASFQKSMARNPGDTMLALRCAFDQWFDHAGRRLIYDRDSIINWSPPRSRRWFGGGTKPRLMNSAEAEDIGETPQPNGGSFNYLTATRGPALNHPKYSRRYAPEIFKRLTHVLRHHGFPTEHLKMGRDTAEKPLKSLIPETAGTPFMGAGRSDRK